MDDERKEVTVDGEPVKLTPIEYRILLLLVQNPGKSSFPSLRSMNGSGTRKHWAEITP